MSKELYKEHEVDIKERSLSLLTRNFVNDSVTTAIIGAIGRAAGFFIPLFIAAWFGVSTETDILFFSYGLITSLTNILAIVFESTVVPFVIEARNRDREQASKFVGDLIQISSILFIIVSAFFLVFGRKFIGLITAFNSEEVALAYKIFLEGIFVIFLWTATSVLAGAFNALQWYSLPSISPAIRFILILAITYLFKDTIGIHAVIMGFVAGETLRFLILAIIGYRLRLVRFSFDNPFTPDIKKYLRTASWQIFGFCFISLNPVVDRVMASYVGLGGISILDYAEKAFNIPLTLISLGPLTVLLSLWSNDLQVSDNQTLRIQVLKMAGLFTISVSLFGIFCFVLREPIITVMYGRGEFDLSDISNVANAFGVYMLGFGPHVGGLVFTRYYLAAKQTKILMISSILNFIIHVVLNLWFVNLWGINGLAASTSMTSFVIAMALFMNFIRLWRV